MKAAVRIFFDYLEERWFITYAEFKVFCGGRYDGNLLRCGSVVQRFWTWRCEGDTANEDVLTYGA